MPCIRWCDFFRFLFCAAFLPPLGGKIRLRVALFRCRSIRATIALLPVGNTGSCSPYVAIAPYGLMFALCRYRSIRAHVRPMSLSLHTGSGAGYVLTFVARIRQRTRAEFNSLRSSIFGVYSFDRADRTSDIGSKSGS